MTDSKIKRTDINELFGVIYRILPLVFAVILLLFFAFYDQSAHKFDENASAGQIFTVLTFLFSAVILCFLKSKDKLTDEVLVILLLLCGFALRLGYALRYQYSVNQHDVESLASSGHLSYIYSIFNGSLPDTNDWQFSHPPLHHFLAALSMKLSYAFGFTLGRSFENIQLLTVLYSSLSMFAGYEILKMCCIKGRNLILCVALLAFHPTFFILAGSINNDMLTIMLSMFSVLFLIKWWNRPCIKFALLCGVFCGAAMMSKVSAALIAVVTAVTVLIKFFRDKRLRFGSMCLQTVCYLAVLLPLGLWHPLRNYLLFGQPLGYVAEIPVTSSLYIGDVSILKRLILPFSIDRVNVYTDVWDEYNLWHYTLRNSLFGEYDFGKEGIAFVLVCANFFLIVISIIGLFSVLFSRCDNKGRFVPLYLLFAVQLVFFVYFNIRYPFGCTMDFRYIVPLLFCGIAFLGAFKEKICSANNTLLLVMNKACDFIVIVFCLLSLILFI